MTDIDTETNEPIEDGFDEIWDISRRLHFAAVIKAIKGNNKEEIPFKISRFIRFLYKLEHDEDVYLKCTIHYEYTDDISEFEDIDNAIITYEIIGYDNILLNKNKCKPIMLKRIKTLCDSDADVEMYIRRYCIAVGNAYSSVYGLVPRDPFMKQARKEWEAKNKANPGQ